MGGEVNQPSDCSSLYTRVRAERTSQIFTKGAELRALPRATTAVVSPMPQ